MTVLRVKHQENYVVLSKEILENQEISLRAKGLWAFCMSKPNDWQFHVRQLASTLKEGKSALYTILKELIKFGYVTRDQARSEKGKFEVIGYVIHEISQLKKCLPLTENPHADNRDAESRTLLSNNPTDDIPKEIPPTPLKGGRAKRPKKDSIERKDYGEYVKLSDQEYEDLLNLVSEDSLKTIILEMNEHLKMTGKKPYVCYRTALGSWIRKRLENPKFQLAQSEVQNRKIAQKVVERYGKSHGFYIKDGSLIVWNEKINGYSGLELKTHGFKEIIINALRKMKLDFEWL